MMQTEYEKFMEKEYPNYADEEDGEVEK